MASNLLSIGRSGTLAARIALDVTAQNIANVASEGYVRRSVSLAEVASAGGIGRDRDVSLSGVRLDRVVRNADLFRQAEARRTSSDAARAGAEIAGLENVEAAIEQAQLFPALTNFESALQQLSSDTTNPSLRAAAVEGARTLARSFNLAAQSIDAVGEGLRFEAAAGVEQLNIFAGELARVNLKLARSSEGSSDQSVLLDQRDRLLQSMSAVSGIHTSIGPDQMVEVRLGGSAGAVMVAGGTSNPLAMTAAADGTIDFTVAGNPATPVNGSLAGQAQALDFQASTRTRLDMLAADLAATMNGAQANGAALDGSAGQPMFAGNTADSLAVVLSGGAALATAPSGSPAGSRDPGGLTAMLSGLGAANISGNADALYFDISSMVAGRRTTREALDSIAASARIALQSQAGVDLDQEAVNLIRFQQAFQASARVIETASTIFDTLLAAR